MKLLNTKYFNNGNNGIDYKKKFHQNHSPLKSSHPSFKGLGSLSKKLVKYDVYSNWNEAKALFQEKTGINITTWIRRYAARKGFSPKATEKLSRFFIENGTLKVKGRSTLKIVLDSVLYPVTKMPFELANFILGATRKVPGLKTLSNKLYFSKFLKNMRWQAEADNVANAVNNIMSITTKKAPGWENLIFKQAHRLFDPKIGKYDSNKERGITRIVTGLTTAYFLSNDAYNLSRICDDNPKLAKKEKKIRLNQELMRVFSITYLNYIIASAFPKLVNTSKAFLIGTATATIFVSEVMARLLNGKPVTFISAKQAKALSEKENNTSKNKKIQKSISNNYKPSEKLFFKNAGNFDFKLYTPQNTEKKKTNKSRALLNLSTFTKTFAILAATGVIINNLRRITKVEDVVQSVFKPAKDFYKYLTKTELTLPRENFNNFIGKMKQAGFESFANKYEQAVRNQIGDKVSLGMKDKSYKFAVDFCIAPFKFMWGIIALPSRLTTKIYKLARNLVAHTPQKAKELGTTDYLSRAYLKLKENKMLDKSPQEIKQFLNSSMFHSFNNVSASNMSNSELSKIAVTAASFATMGFKIADHYNMVMMKSAGKDKDEAEIKAKERSMQEISRLFYKTLLIDTFNNAFSKLYHSSLTGASVINIMTQGTGEMLSRSSVGIPILESTRDNILTEDKKNEERKGIVGAYFRFMSKLTGKKPLSENTKFKSKQVQTEPKDTNADKSIFQMLKK